MIHTAKYFRVLHFAGIGLGISALALMPVPVTAVADDNGRNARNQRPTVRNNVHIPHTSLPQKNRNGRSHNNSWDRFRYNPRTRRIYSYRPYTARPYPGSRQPGYRPNFRSYNNGQSYYSHGYPGYRPAYTRSTGIPFVFGNTGARSYRWAPTRYHFYRPGSISYSIYVSNTRCQRMLVSGYHYGHQEMVSVIQCYNPYDGHYLLEGSEQVRYCDY